MQSDLEASVKVQADKIESIINVQYDLNKHSRRIQWAQYLGLVFWGYGVYELFRGHLIGTLIFVFLGFLVTYISFRVRRSRTQIKLKELANEWGVDRRFTSLGMASVVKNKSNGRIYSISTSKGERPHKIWETALAEGAPGHADFFDALYAIKSESLHDAIFEHVKLEYVVKNNDPEKWQKIIMIR